MTTAITAKTVGTATAVSTVKTAQAVQNATTASTAAIALTVMNVETAKTCANVGIAISAKMTAVSMASIERLMMTNAKTKTKSVLNN